MSTDLERLELLYEPCRSKEELYQHIKTFLKVDLPCYTIDEDSTSNPLELIWSVYHTMLTGKGPQRVVAACARNTMKTLSAAIIRFYAMIHFRRSGTHLAATQDQSQSLLMYLERFLNIDGVREYITTTNTRTKELTGLPANSFTKNHTCVLRIAVATKAGVNSQRGSYNSKDELELIPPEIIREAAFIADPTQDEHRFGPIELDLSSRKLADGPMQEKIDEAESKNPPEDLRLHKWSLVDFMKRCPEEIHKPDEPRIKAFLNTESLQTIWSENEYAALPEGTKGQYKEINAYAGCKTCPAFLACQARSPKQQGNSTALRDIGFVGVILKAVKDPDTIISQALNSRPGKSGNVYKVLRKYKHYLEPIKFYKWCFGEYFVPKGMDPEHLKLAIANSEWWQITPTKEDIYKRFSEEGWIIHYGVDWAYAPARAVCICLAYHRRTGRAAVFHVEASDPESGRNYSNQDWAKYIGTYVHTRFPADLVCPDMADPASPTYFAPFRMRCIDTKPSRIEQGVSQIRGLLFDASTQQEKFIILNDGSEGNELLYNAMEKWTHRKTPLGFDYDKFEDDDYCDFNDPTRYALAPFIEDKQVTISVGQKAPTHSLVEAMALGDKDAKETIEKKQELRSQMQEYFQMEHGISNPFAKPTNVETGRLQPITETKENKPKPKNGGIKFRV